MSCFSYSLATRHFGAVFETGKHLHTNLNPQSTEKWKLWPRKKEKKNVGLFIWSTSSVFTGQVFSSSLMNKHLPSNDSLWGLHMKLITRSTCTLINWINLLIYNKTYSSFVSYINGTCSWGCSVDFSRHMTFMNCISGPADLAALWLSARGGRPEFNGPSLSSPLWSLMGRLRGSCSSAPFHTSLVLFWVLFKLTLALWLLHLPLPSLSPFRPSLLHVLPFPSFAFFSPPFRVTHSSAPWCHCLLFLAARLQVLATMLGGESIGN